MELNQLLNPLNPHNDIKVRERVEMSGGLGEFIDYLSCLDMQFFGIKGIHRYFAQLSI
jgi:hypothetical protein